MPTVSGCAIVCSHPVEEEAEGVLTIRNAAEDKGKEKEETDEPKGSKRMRDKGTAAHENEEQEVENEEGEGEGEEEEGEEEHNSKKQKVLKTVVSTSVEYIFWDYERKFTEPQETDQVDATPGSCHGLAHPVADLAELFIPNRITLVAQS
jgi:hypothetical protein